VVLRRNLLYLRLLPRTPPARPLHSSRALRYNAGIPSHSRIPACMEKVCAGLKERPL
jgi:hypothetical protein